MKQIFITIFALMVTSAKKEQTENINAVLKDPKLAAEFYQVVKRLAINIPQEKQSPVNDDNRPACRNKVYENTIIRTSDSRKAGAKFLLSIQDVKSNENCYEECCNTDGCDLSVYGKGDETNHNCYLFQCKDDITKENKCLFNNYTGYVSSTVTKIKIHQMLQPAETKDHLDSLKEKTETPPTTTSATTTLPPKSTPPPTERPHTVTLGGVCHSRLSCEDPNARCIQGLCQCKDSFYKKQHICRQICIAEKEFECRGRGTSRRGPDCITSSLVCDGTHDCADGSDELNCPTKATTSVKSTWINKLNQKDSTEEKSETEDNVPLPESESSESVDDGFPPLDNKEEWDYNEENKEKSNKSFKLSNSEQDSFVKSTTDSYHNIPASSSEQKKYDQHEENNPKVPMPFISWADEEETFDDNKPDGTVQNKQSLQDELSLSLMSDDEDSISQDRNEDMKSAEQFDTVSRPRGGRPEAIPRPTQTVDSNPGIVSHPEPESVPNTSLDDTRLPKTDSKSSPFDKDNWSNYVKNSGLSPPVRPIESTPYSDLPYNLDQFNYPQGRPYPPNIPYQPSPPRFTPNQMGRYNGYRYPGYNQQYPGYNIDYSDYDSYPSEQDQDLRHTNFQLPSYPGGGYRPNIGQPGRRPTQDLQPGLINQHDNNGKSLEPTSSRTSQHLNNAVLDKDVPTQGSSSKQPESNDSENKDDSKSSQEKTILQKAKTEKETHTTQTIPADKHSKTDKKEKPVEKIVKSNSNQKTESKTKQDEIEILEKESFVTREKVIVASPTDSAQGPIVALSLGLAITLVLLVFVGCRLRNVRRRLRKGRPLHSNEADYLINGMYL